MARRTAMNVPARLAALLLLSRSCRAASCSRLQR